jgi:hypothetical protein
MIARDVEVIDLDPALWKNLAYFWKMGNISESSSANPKMLSILHNQGHVLKMSVPKEQTIPTMEHVDDPQELARKLYYQYPGMAGVQILDKHSIQIYSSKVQNIEWHSLDYDDFLIRAYQLADEDPVGLCFFPKRQLTWHGFEIRTVRDWLAQLPSPSAVVVGIFRDAAPWFSLVIRLVDKKIKLVTTLEHLSRFEVDVSRLPSSVADLGSICELVSQHIAPVSAALVCNFSFAEQLAESTHKRESLARAIEEGQAAIQGIPLG